MPDANMELRSGFLQPDGTLQSEMLLDERTCDCCALASTATQNALVVAYRDRSADEIREISVVRYEHGKWSAPSQISKDAWKIKGCPVNGPALASAGKEVLLVWYNLQNEKPTIQFSRSSDESKTWSQALQIHDKTPIGQVNVVRMPDGTALVSWLENGDQGSNLVLRRIRPDGNLEAVKRVANVGEGRGGIPQLAIFQEALYLTWTSVDTEKQKRVHVQKLDV